MDEKSNDARKQVYQVTKHRAGNLVRIRFSLLVLGLVWIIDHEDPEEIQLVIGFINRNAVCHVGEMLVLWSEMEKPSLIARSVF